MSTEAAEAQETTVIPHTPNNQVASGNQVATTNPARMIELAIEKGANVEQLERLLALQERWEANEARKAYVQAMTRFKANRPTIYKNKDVGYDSRKGGGRTEYSHATLDNVDEVLGEHLSRVGISYSWRTRNLEGGWVEVTCVLTHELGHSESNTLAGPPDQSGNKNMIQAMGSTKTYLERYTLLGVTGTTVRGMDDDGQGGAQGPDPRVQAAAQQRQQTAPGNQAQQDPSLVNENQRQALQGAIERAGTTAEKFCKAAGIPSLDQLQAHRFKGAMQNLNAKAQRINQQTRGAQQ